MARHSKGVEETRETVRDAATSGGGTKPSRDSVLTTRSALERLGLQGPVRACRPTSPPRNMRPPAPVHNFLWKPAPVRHVYRCTLHSDMIRAFRNAGIQHVFHDVRSKLAVKTCPPELWRVAQRRLDQLNQAEAFDDLRAPPGNRLELEAGDRASQHRIRIN